MTLVDPCVVCGKNTHAMTLVGPYGVCEKNTHAMTLVDPYVVCGKNTHAMNTGGTICGLLKEHTFNDSSAGLV